MTDPATDFGPDEAPAEARPRERGTVPSTKGSEPSCIPENLLRLRRDREWTQAQLAERANLSPVAVRKIERGVVYPRTLTLHDLARALEVPVGELLTRVRPLRSVRFRARARLHGREQILAEVSKWLDAYRMLETELDDAREFRFRPAGIRGRRPTPDAAARTARRAAGLTPQAPIADICQLLEDCGVKVLLLNRKLDSFFGLSVGAADGGPAVVVNTWNRISVERRIFTAARELGHLLLHSDQYGTAETEPSEDAETEADAFAAEFLMPESSFGPAWDATAGHPLLSRVLRVKRVFGVSYRSVLRRLVETERRTGSVWMTFQAQHARRFGRTLRRADEPQGVTESGFAPEWRRGKEPAALPGRDFLGSRMRHLVRRALEDGLITMSRAAEILGMRLEPTREWVRKWAM